MNKVLERLHSVHTSPARMVQCFNALFAVDKDEAWGYAERAYGLVQAIAAMQEMGITCHYGRKDAFFYLLNGGDESKLTIKEHSVEISWNND